MLKWLKSFTRKKDGIPSEAKLAFYKQEVAKLRADAFWLEVFYCPRHLDLNLIKGRAKSADCTVCQVEKELKECEKACAALEKNTYRPKTRRRSERG